MDPLAGVLGYWLRRASAAAMASLTTDLAELELRPAEMSVLLVIEANRGVTQSQVSRCLGIQRANMVPIAASLERRKLIERIPADRRSQAMRLTRAGSKAVSRSRKIIEAHESRLVSGLDEAERTAVIAFLKDIPARLARES